MRTKTSSSRTSTVLLLAGLLLGRACSCQMLRSRQLIGRGGKVKRLRLSLVPGATFAVCRRALRGRKGKYAKLPNVVVSSVPGAQRRVSAAKALREPKGAARLRRAEGARLCVGLHPA